MMDRTRQFGKSIWYTGTRRYAATMRVENVFSLIFVSIGNAVSPYVSQNLGDKRKFNRIQKGYHAALVLDLCFTILAFVVIENHVHTEVLHYSWVKMELT